MSFGGSDTPPGWYRNLVVHPDVTAEVGGTTRRYRARTLGEDEAQALYKAYSVAAPAAPLFQAATANLNPWTEAKVNTKNPDRGPLLIIFGEKDHTVPWAIANASYKRQKRNAAVTEIKQIPNRGHSLTIDSGWQEVAQTALDFVKRFT